MLIAYWPMILKDMINLRFWAYQTSISFAHLVFLKNVYAEFISMFSCSETVLVFLNFSFKIGVER